MGLRGLVRVKALGAIERGEPTDPPPPIGNFIAQVTPWISIIGVISLASDAAPWWLGVAFIVVGVALTNRFKPNDEVSPTQPLSAPR